MSQRKLRFAALIRVSTETQEKQGESLRTQKQAIKKAVEQYGGRLVAFYEGQEHATPGHERQLLEKLLKDANLKPRPFDAVICFDPSRWSRDNRQSKEGLDILKSAGVRFFTTTSEHDLHAPQATLFLGLHAEFAEYEASERNLKSTLSAIERAKRCGAPTRGKKPWGLIWCKKSEQWSIDHAKQATLISVADRYLAGESMGSLAIEIGINPAFLHKTIMSADRESYTIEFGKSGKLAPHLAETVTIPIPQLIPKRLGDALRRQAERNKTHQRGCPGNREYVLSGYVFCEECGYALSGQKNSQGKRYYRHRRNGDGCSCRRVPKPFVSAEWLETEVINQIFEMLGDVAGIKRAIERAVPDRQKVEAARNELQRLEEQLSSLDMKRDRLVELYADGVIDRSKMDDKVAGIDERLDLLRKRRVELGETLAKAPTVEAVDEAIHRIRESKNRFPPALRRAIWGEHALHASVDALSNKDKKELVEAAFSGHSSGENRLGVFVGKLISGTKRPNKHYAIRIVGNVLKLTSEGVTLSASR